MTTEPATAHRRTPARATRLNRDAVVNAALSFLDRAGWDALTINALAVELGTKGPSLYNHVDSLDDLRHEVRDRVLAEIVGMLHTVKPRGAAARTRFWRWPAHTAATRTTIPADMPR